ncbi:MAG: Smr/MutS family protein [Myxococcota bacterium]|nr:Smr/MutS family protein [Myxococcota bacterium]
METGQEVRAVRLDHNTVDLRGQRVDAALALVEQHIDALVVRGESFGFVLHGHGTGALNTAVRRWLPQARTVRRWRPANAEEGGDAFTVIELG